MKSLLRPLLLGSALAFVVAPPGLHAETKPAVTLPALSATQLNEGFKSGLGTIISQALNSGTAVTVESPKALAKVETALAKVNKTEASAGFSSALSETVAKVAPQAATLLQGSLASLKIDDAKSLLAGGSTAGTDFLKKAVAPTLREQLLPLVKQATASTALGAKAKDMLGAVGPLAGLGGKSAITDLDAYVCDQVIEQSFALVGKQEAAVRANPALLTGSPLAQKVFALFKK